MQEYVFTLLEVMQRPVVFYIVVAVLGLVIGSFLNVVIYRLPKMLEHQWYEQSTQFLLELKNQGRRDLYYEITQTTSQTKPEAPTYNLFLPPSQCPECQQTIKFWQNIPVLSYLFLLGRCGHCKAAISPRYPIIELLTAFLSIVVAYYFGFSVQTLAGLFFTWLLIALAIIDMNTQLLPDNLTLFGLWLGLVFSLLYVFVSPQQAIIGAIAGYLALWLIYWAFKLLTHKEGMGYGDFKLLAMAGAWLGWKALPLIIFIAALTGTLWGGARMLLGLSQREHPMPFGPFLALSAWITFIYGEQIINLYLRWAY